MTASPMAETAGVAVRCRTLRAVNGPGHAGRGAAAADTPVGPVWSAAGEGPAAVITHSSAPLGIRR